MRDVEEIAKTRNLTIKRQGAESMFGYWFNPLSMKRFEWCMSWFGGWEHLMVTGKKTPTWDEMSAFKNMFWKESETCVQYHPAKDDYVNCSETSLHIWRPLLSGLPTPPSSMVGPKGISNQDVGAFASGALKELSPKELAEMLNVRYGDVINRKMRRKLK